MAKRMIDDLYDAMPWDAIDTVVFDVGKVLLDFNPQEIMEKLFPGEAHLHKVLYERAFTSPYWVMIDRGAMTLAEAAEAMAGRDASLLPATEKLMFGWMDLPTIQEGIDALRNFKAHGKKLYVLSNFNDEAFRIVRSRHDFFQLFDGFVVSAEEHITKPDPAIYHLLTERFGAEPSRTLFIDDSQANIEAAMFCGWQGLHYNRPGKLRDFLQAK